jgi:hypothetical protein
MTGLIVERKTGFINNNPDVPIIINDFRGKVFYSTIDLRGVKKFNLPRGKYLVGNGDFSVLRNPVYYKKLPLPIPERNFDIPVDFTLVFADNINKCTVNWDLKTITFDRELLNLPLPDLFFILYHEYGHHLYNTEKYADAYACNTMLGKGYNPSQIGIGQINTLSLKQLPRKEYLIDSIIKNAKQR